MSARVDLVPGNTRLRARWPAVLRGEQLAGLHGPADVAAVLRAAGNRVPADASGRLDPSGLLEAVDGRRDDRLRAAVGAYEGAARDLVGTLVSDVDRADLVALLRGAATGAAPERILDAVRAVGRLDPVTARELVADEADALLARLVARRLPDPATAHAVAAAWRQFELHRDLAELEVAAARAHMASTLQALDRFGPVADPIRAHLARGRDAVNLVTALRLRARGEAAAGDLLPPGTVALPALRAVAAGGDVVAAAPLPWRPAIARAAGGGVEAVARTLDELVEAAALRPARRTDPLGASVPVAYVVAVTAEARALRRAVLPAVAPAANTSATAREEAA